MLFGRHILNIFVKIITTAVSLGAAFFIFTNTTQSFIEPFLLLITIRLTLSFFLYYDYKLAWSLASIKTVYHKTILGLVTLLIFTPCVILFYDITLKAVTIEWVLYHFITFTALYSYSFYKTVFCSKNTEQEQTIIIYGAGLAGTRIGQELIEQGHSLLFYIDDCKKKQNRAINGIEVLSRVDAQQQLIMNEHKVSTLIFAMSSCREDCLKERFDTLQTYFENTKILPPIKELYEDKSYTQQIKNIGVEELLARHPKKLDTQSIENFIKGKTILVTGAGGSIGSELSRQCIRYHASHVILLDHDEINIYNIDEKGFTNTTTVLLSVIVKNQLEEVFKIHKPEVVLHAAAYKHVPICESNMDAAIQNNIIGTKNCIDLAIKYHVKKFVLISTDKAVRPTNVMGATKRICELYAQNSNQSGVTDIVAVRFGNVLGSSGSVIPRFRKLVSQNRNLTVTHKDITRYFMLIPEACQLVLQAASIASGGEVFILDMGKPVKIYDLAQRFLELSGRNDLGIDITGLRPGEKLYEELLLKGSEKKTPYPDIFISSPTPYRIDKLNYDIKELVLSDDKISELKKIVPEFTHQPNKPQKESPTEINMEVNSKNENQILVPHELATLSTTIISFLTFWK